MDTVLLILAFCLMALSLFLFSRSRLLMDELKKTKEEISQMKNIGDLLSVTESTLEEADNAIETAKKVMDKRIRKMEELVARFEKLANQIESNPAKGNSSSIDRPITQQSHQSSQDDYEDPDALERRTIAKRNREIILMLEENISPEEIARRTGASMHEINLIRKFIKSR